MTWFNQCTGQLYLLVFVTSRAWRLERIRSDFIEENCLQLKGFHCVTDCKLFFSKIISAFNISVLQLKKYRYWKKEQPSFLFQKVTGNSWQLFFQFHTEIRRFCAQPATAMILHRLHYVYKFRNTDWSKFNKISTYFVISKLCSDHIYSVKC